MEAAAKMYGIPNRGLKQCIENSNLTKSEPDPSGFAASAPTGTGTMRKGGVSTSISTRHQCITCMKEYENKSLEERRVEDYAANRKGGSAGGITFGGATQTGGLFGSTPAASTSGFSFGTTQSKPLFGTTGTTNAFGCSNSTFGQPTQTQNTELLGKSVAFDTTTTAAPPIFNFGGTNTIDIGTSLFGQNNQQKSLFGEPTSNTDGLFETTASTQSTGFGTTGGFGAFGATNQPSHGESEFRELLQKEVLNRNFYSSPQKVVVNAHDLIENRVNLRERRHRELSNLHLESDGILQEHNYARKFFM